MEEYVYHCELCGNGYSFTIECPNCLGSLGNKPIKEMGRLEMYNEIAKIDSLNNRDRNRCDIVEHRRQLLEAITNA